MAEWIDLPQPVGPTTSSWRVFALHLERGLDGDAVDPSRSFIEVLLFGSNGLRKNHRWSGPAADADIVALNKANLTTNSLQKRVMSKLIADGVIEGAVSGTAD